MTKNSMTCVVICYWTGRSTKPLLKLLSQMQRYPAGAPFDVVIVCNGGDVRPLVIPDRFKGLRLKVINRENTGWNLGAWEAGWRASPDYEYFLFLQAECFIKSKDWLYRFKYRMDCDAGIGLLGERLMWNGMTWDYVRSSTELDLGTRYNALDAIDRYQIILGQKGIDAGVTGTHIVSIILFTRRNILEEIDGFPLIGESYVEAISCEIGFSKSFENRGYRIAQLADDAFFKIGHTQWTESDRYKQRVLDYLRSQVRRVLRRNRWLNRRVRKLERSARSSGRSTFRADEACHP